MPLLDAATVQGTGARCQPEILFDTAELVVQAEWNGWRTAMVRFADLQRIHWHQPAGARRSLIHAYVRCTDVRSGEIPHDCHAKSRPHSLLVCVLRRHVAEDIFQRLCRLAERRATPRSGTFV